MAKSISRIKTNPLSRRLSLSVAGFKSGSSYALGGLSNLLKSGEERQQANEALLAREARRFVHELGKLKGAYVKIGQMLGIYGEHILPSAVTTELQQLNDQTIHLSWSSINQKLNESLGAARDQFIVDEKPIAAASLAQVHKAIHVPSGQTLCLKIQYPGVADAIDSDFRDVIRLLELSRWLKKNKESGSVIEEIHRLLKEETDYCREAAMSQKISALLATDSRYLVPKVYSEFSNRDLLVMDYVTGDKVNSPALKSLPQEQRNALAKAVLDLFFKEIFQWHLMQTDPNFGNFLVTFDNKRPKLTLLDFGAVREFEPKLMQTFCLTIAAAIEQDLEKTIDGLYKLKFIRQSQQQESREKFAHFCFLLVEPFNAKKGSAPDYVFNAQGEYCWGKSNLVRRAAKYAANAAISKDFVTPPPEFALITRKLSGVFSTLAALDAEFNAGPIIQPYLNTNP